MAARGFALGGFCLLRSLFLKGGYVQTGKSHAAVIIKPYNNTAPLRVDIRVISSGDAVAAPAARDKAGVPDR